MNAFSLKNGQLHAESVPLSDIATRFGTPCYVYSRAALEGALDEFQQELSGLDSLVCYALKANSNLAVLDVFARRGAGFDIVSIGELKRALAAGAEPQKIVFSGVGKSADEMVFALSTGILCFNVESAPELDRLNAVATSLGKKAPISLRVNPDVDAMTHPYISTGLKENKFGVAYEEALKTYQHAASLPNLEITGIDCHIGSQLLDPSPFAEALDKILLLIDQLAANGISLKHIDLGGGLGIRYKDEAVPSVKSYLQPLLHKLRDRRLKILLMETELLKVVARLFEVPRWLIPELTREETRRRARLWTTAATVIGLVVSGVTVAAAVAYQQSQLSQLARALALINTAQRLSDSGDHASAALVALEALPQRSAWLPGPDVPEAQAALFRSLTELRERGVLRGHDGTISELRFTGDGRRVISASRDKTIRVWDAETATELRKLDLDAKPLAVSRLGGTDGPGMAVLDDGKVVEFHTDSSVVRVSATLPAGPWQAAYMSTGDDRVALIGKDEQAGGTSWRVLLADVRSGSVVLDHKLPIEASAFVWSPVEAVAMIGLVDGQILRVGRDNDSAPAPFYKLGKSIRSLAFSGDGRRLLAADADGVQVWYGLAGAPLVSLPRGRSSILRATISGNSELVAVGRWDNCVELWDVTHQRLRHLLNTPCRRDGDYPLQPNMLSFSADASELISASDDRKAVVWNTTNGHPSLVFAGHGDRLERAISDDGGKRFATASSGVISDRHDIHLWSREAVLAPGVLDHGAKVSIDFVAVSPDERLVATATDTGTTRVWLLSTGVEVAHFELGRKPTVLSFVAGTNALLIAGEGRLVLWDLVNQRNLVDLGDVSTAIESWSLSSGSAPRVAFGAQTGGLRVLDLTTGQAFDIAAANDFGSIRVATIRPDAQQIAYADERRIAIWDAATATTVHRLQLDAGDVRDVQWSPDGRTLFITTSNDSLMIWRVGEEKPRLVQPEAAFAGTLRFDTAGAVALTRTGSSVHTYDVLSGRHLAELSGETVYAVHAHQGSLQDARFSPDGRYVVTASYDRTAKIWEASSGRHVRTLSGHGDFVRSAQYTVDGKRIVTSAVITENSVDTDQQVGVSEAKVIVWDAASGKPVALISGEDQSVSGVALTADGRRLITASFVFGEVTRSFVWPLLRNSAEITAFACTSLPRRLTPDQRRVLLGAEFSARD